MNLLISTIIPVHNRPEMLRNAVKSVMCQTYRDIEVVLIDDGSTDGTTDVMDELRKSYPDIIRCYTQVNQGPGPARELGRLNSRGEFIQYLDSDDRLLPNKFADQVATLCKHPDCDIAYGLSRLVDSDGRVLADPFKWTGRDLSFLFPGLLVDRWWCTHTPLYRKSLTDRIGGWSNMRWSQDWEYDARAGGMNVKVVSCGTYVSEHVHHDGQRQTSGADWSTDPVRLRNRLELLRALWSNAKRARTELSCLECQHFARWAFSIARQSAAIGLQKEAIELLEIAAEAGRHGPGGRGLNCFRLLAKLVGWRQAGRLARRLERHSRGASSSTMNQSFSGQVDL